jgi:hypothetical protein
MKIHDHYTDTTVYFEDRADHYNVSCPGTNSLRDILNILNGGYVNIGHNRKVSQGVHRAAMAVWFKIRPKLTDPKKPMKVSGHSLGGGIAQILAYRSIMASRPCSLSVSGSIRTGNRAFISFLESYTTQFDWYEYGNDPVPLIWPWMSRPKDREILKPRTFPWLDFDLVKGDHMRYWE